MLLTCFLTGNGTEMFISLVISVYPGYKSIKVRLIIKNVIISTFYITNFIITLI